MITDRAGVRQWLAAHPEPSPAAPEVLRNVIAEQLLDLPREPRPTEPS